MNESVRGLILKQIDYRESDVILSVLTEEYGKLSFLAAGARKISSKNAGAIIPCTIAEIQFDWRMNRSVQRLKTARAKKMYPRIHRDLNASACAMMMAETADVMTLAEDELGTAEAEAQLLEKGWDALEAGHRGDLITALYLADMMKLFGIEPDVDECVRCGSLSVSAVSAEDGGFLCPDCAAKAGVQPLPAEQLRQFRLIVKAGLTHMDHVLEKTDGRFSGLGYLSAMIRLHAGVSLRSFDLVGRLFAIE